MLERTQVFRLRDKYLRKKSSGYDVDEETGAIIVYALDCVFYEGIYYSMEEGGPITFDSYDTEQIVKVNKKYSCNLEKILTNMGFQVVE